MRLCSEQDWTASSRKRSWHDATPSRVENATRITTNTALITMLPRPLKAQFELVGKDDDKETVAQSVKQPVLRLRRSEGAVIRIACGKEKSLVVVSKTEFRVPCPPDMFSLC
jgi:hypothetical protein